MSLKSRQYLFKIGEKMNKTEIIKWADKERGKIERELKEMRDKLETEMEEKLDNKRDELVEKMEKDIIALENGVEKQKREKAALLEELKRINKCQKGILNYKGGDQK